MKDNTEYQIFIGCHDSQLRGEFVSEDELKEMVVKFFRRKKMDFSMFSVKGGYLHEDGKFISENSICINIIGSGDLDIIKLVKSLSMFMNQECVLITRNALNTEFQ